MTAILSIFSAFLIASAPAEPSALPSGMELLYGDRVPIRPDGEPAVALGLATGERRLNLTLGTETTLDFYDQDLFKRATLRPGARLVVTIVKSKAGVRTHYVDLQGVPFGAPEALEEKVNEWQDQGYPVVVIEEGTVIGIGGKTIDTRELRITLPAKSSAEALQIASDVYERTGVRAFASARLSVLPWGRLRVDVDGAPLSLATSYVRLTPATTDGTITLRGLEFGRGFAHHGREDRSYAGEIYLAVDAGGDLAAVNVLGAETLLRGVVPSELFASAHPESLKSQAVAARNQLFSKLGRRHHDDPFHLCDEQHCQVYTGINREDPRTNAAIRQTRGELLFHRGRLVDTVYSSTCGGHTENNENVWGNAADPALRGRPDIAIHDRSDAPYADGLDESELARWFGSSPRTYCATASKVSRSKFRWSKRLPRKRLESLAKKYRIGAFQDLKILERGSGGRVISIALEGASGRHTIVHELPIRRFFDGLNSGAFVLEREYNAQGVLQAMTFRGGGWGHGVGMCQLGAIGRAEAGHDYQTILRHYYNDANVVRIYSDAHARR